MDLLSTLGKKESTAAEGVDKSTPPSTTSVKDTSKDLPGSKDLLNTVGSNKSESAATDQSGSAGVKNSNSPDSSGKGEPTGADASSGEWTTDSLFKEIKKLREENKTVRIKYQENVESLKKDMDNRISAREKEVEQYAQAKKELEELKEKEADKKRDLAEKLAHREAALAEARAKLEFTDKSYQDKLKDLEVKLSSFEAQNAAQKAVYQKRLEDELAVIPEKYKDVASLIVKGAGDPADALVALNEAKIKGVFEDKTIIVNHSVPGAADGARSTKDRLDAAGKEARDKMTSLQKIGQALKDMKAAPNSAFRNKI
jgi:DNA repair exonuclease SbcCD ATPase subunit